MLENSGLELISCRNVASGTASSRPGFEIRAVRNARWPVRRFSSPRKRCAPCVATTTSFESSIRTICTSPSRTTKKSGVGPPARYRTSPATTSRTSPTASSSASVRASRSGHAVSAPPVSLIRARLRVAVKSGRGSACRLPANDRDTRALRGVGVQRRSVDRAEHSPRCSLRARTTTQTEEAERRRRGRNNRSDHE